MIFNNTTEAVAVFHNNSSVAEAIACDVQQACHRHHDAASFVVLWTGINARRLISAKSYFNATLPKEMSTFVEIADAICLAAEPH